MKFTYFVQIICAVLLAVSAVLKFTGDPGSVAVFVGLEMEPSGRYVIACIEVVAALLLLSPMAAVGSLLTVGLMCGAILAHTTELGLVVNDGGGRFVAMLVAVLICAAYVMVSRRKELPLIGDTL